MTALNGKRIFPCPVCGVATEVRITKKSKPYITCDPCGIQLFVRGPGGIRDFNRLVARGGTILEILTKLEERYHLTCPECGTRFWAEPQLAKASMFDGHLQGFRCPECDEAVPWKTKE